MNLKRFLGIVLLILVSVTSISYGTGPREPLTFKNVGIYGGWNEYFVSKDLPFDFLIVQAFAYKEGIGWSKNEKGDMPGVPLWNEWLKRARANDKRIIADFCPIAYDKDGNPQSLPPAYNEKTPLPIESYFPSIDRFFKTIDVNELYAITLSEEHVFWNGQKERLIAVYEYIKKNYPEVPVYQWYSPSHEGSIPGLNWPNLPSDGWMADEYFLQQPAMEIAMREYKIFQKPVFQIIWASASENTSIPWSEKTFWDQFTVCRKYDIPVAFFCHSGEKTNTWVWEPQASRPMRDLLENFCIYAATLAKRLPAVPLAEWDFVPWAQKPLQLKEEAARKGYWSYGETFAKERGLQIMADSMITGFANLRWDSSSLEFRPRSAGESQVELRYVFDKPKNAGKIRVKAVGKTSGGSVNVVLCDMRNTVLAQAALKGDTASVEFDSSKMMDQKFVVLFQMSGNAKKAGDVLSELASISVEAQLAE